MKINSYINRYDNFLDNDLRDALLLETFSYRRKWKKLDELRKSLMVHQVENCFDPLSEKEGACFSILIP